MTEFLNLKTNIKTMIYICVFDDSFQNDRTLSIFVLEIVLADGTILSYIMHAIDASKHTSRVLKILSCFSSSSFMGCFKYCGQKIAF